MGGSGMIDALQVNKLAVWKKIQLRDVGFGAGFALALIVSIGVAQWWSSRPKQWSLTAITAKPAELVFREQGEELHLQFRYALTNNTRTDYVLALPVAAALMRKVPEDSSLAKLNSARWEDNVRIPSRQTVSVMFEVIFSLSDYNSAATRLQGYTSAGDASPPPALMSFVASRLKEMDGMAFLDYNARYRIELPKGWNKLN
jgi:hypothetical protein